MERPNLNLVVNPLSNHQQTGAGAHDAGEEDPTKEAAVALGVAGPNETRLSLGEWAEDRKVARNCELPEESG